MLKKIQNQNRWPMLCSQIKTAKKYYTEFIPAKTKLLHVPAPTFRWNWLQNSDGRSMNFMKIHQWAAVIFRMTYTRTANRRPPWTATRTVLDTDGHPLTATWTAKPQRSQCTTKHDARAPKEKKLEPLTNATQRTTLNYTKSTKTCKPDLTLIWN